jgi:hypothetical protein
MIIEGNEMRRIGRSSGRNRGYRGYPRKRTCEECRKYSRKTFYCAKHGKVLEMKRAACNFFAPRKKKIPRGRRTY